MRPGRPIPPMTITADERETLERWTRRASTAQALAQRARLILSCAAGKTNTRVAQELRLTKQTVGKNAPLLSPVPGERGASAPRRHCLQPRQSAAPTGPARRHPELVTH